MDEKQLHQEFLSILGESHPGLTFEEYRDSCVFLLFYEYCCLRFDQDLEDSYKLKEMVRLAMRGKLQMPSFLKFMEAASDFIHLVSGQVILTDFLYFKRLQENQSQEKQKSFARFIRKLIKKIDAWNSDEMLYLHFSEYFEELLFEFSKMKKETNISDGILQLGKMLFDYSQADTGRIVIPQFGYGVLLGTMLGKDEEAEVFGYDDNPAYLEIQKILLYMKDIPFSKANFFTKEEFENLEGMSATADRMMLYMPEGINNGELMCKYEDLPYDKELIGTRTKGELPYLLSALTYLKKHGAMVVVFPSAMLYREGKESQIRKFLLEEAGCLDTILLLPDQLFASSGQKEVMMYLKLNRKTEDIMFFDCTDLGQMDEDDVKQIREGMEKRDSIPGFCASASLDKIRENGFNLNFPRYISRSVKEIKLDIKTQKERIAQIDQELLAIEEKIRMYKRDLELN